MPRFNPLSALVRDLLELSRKTHAVLARAQRQKNGDLALKAIARLEKQLELRARLLGDLEGRDAGSVHIKVEYVDKMLVD